jgi:hypothetical protein
VIKHIIAAFTALLVAGCSHMGANDSSTGADIPLVWKPTSSLSMAGAIDLTGRSNARLRIEVTDNRNNSGFIGRNTEKLPPRNVTTPDNVAAFVSEHLSQLISDSGLTEVDSAGTVILKAEILQFFVEETEIYNGDVRLKVTLIDRGGNSVWTGITSGTSTRFGRSYSAENYYETLSDSLIGAVRHLMQNTSFRGALEGAS